MALGVFSVLCWRRFRNLSFMEQFLDYKQVPNGTEVSETTEVIKQNGHIEEAKETGEEAGTEERETAGKKQKLRPRQFPLSSPPPWIPKPEVNVVSVQPQDSSVKDDDEVPYSSSDEEEAIVSTVPREAMTPYDLSDSNLVEQFIPPSEANFLGRVYFSLQFDPARAILAVKLIKGEEFPQYAGDSPNVFLELKLVPAMKIEILKTDIHERNANPNLNEVFEFGLPYEVVRKQNLSFTLMYMDKFSHPFPVGELSHYLDHLEMVRGETLGEEIIVCREMQKLQQAKDQPRDLGFGQVLFSLMFMPLTRRLTIVIFKAQHLRKVKEGFPAIYVEVVMINVRKRQRKRKPTSLRTGSLFPVYNEALAFDVADANLEDIRLQVFVKQEMESSPDQVIGRVVLGTNADGPELQHWKEAMTSKKPIAQWHSLREYHYADHSINCVISPTHKSVISKQKIARFFTTSSEDEAD
ncbi:PREDICTED: synaptotagmin-7-like [Acropora digitifera]|uniref:synaptotagmin-7-like n=1 Tax=Acropora digitifera TaxID=70779 RepID=UPI00077A9D1F|nr:PREDICTED: synaptotagmin-7-like [Acropora digitifera]XP_015772246.1 PREDICTED: synaptotagmin-7-like [Acropora digitifera]